MALKIRRGSDASRLTITPVEGELLYTTDTKKIFVGDGSTLGGTLVSGVGGGAEEGTLPFYSTTNSLSSTEKIKFNTISSTFIIDRGTLAVNNESIPRTVAALNSYFNSAGASTLLFSKSRGTVNVPTALQSGDFVGNIAFNGYGGTVYSTTNSINSSTSGPVAVGTPFTVNYTSKTGTGPYYVTYAIPSQTAPVISRSYTIAGNANTSYNGSYQVTASTTTSMTLQYNTDPGTWGGGTTTASADSILPGTLNIFSQTTNGNLHKTLRVFSNGQVYVGPIATDFPNIPYDSTWNGQLAVTSSQVNPSQTLASAQLALRSYSNTVQGPSMNVLRARGTVVSPLGLNTGDQLYLFKFYGTDSPTNITVAATISVDVDNTISASKIPTSITFSTANATSGAVTQALKIDSTQKVIVAGTVSTTATPGTFWNYDTSGSTITMTLGQTLNFANFSGSVLVNCYNSGTVTQYLCGGGGAPIAVGSSKVTATGTMSSNGGINGYTFTSTEAGVHSFYVIRTRTGA